MAYDPNIPTANEFQDETQPIIQGNFQQLDTTFGVDHIKYSVTANNGKHTKATLVRQGSDPAVASTDALLYNKLSNSQSNIFFRNSAGIYQMTGPMSATANGYTTLPGGIIMQWAKFTAASNTGSINFVTAGINFPAACFMVILQGDDNTTANENLLVTARTNTSFSFKSLNAGKLYTYLAIGN